MSAATVHLDLRSAFRQRLLTLELASLTAMTLSASGSAISDSGSGLAIFAPGDEVEVTGFTEVTNNGVFMVRAAAAGSITLDRALTTEIAGNSVTIAALLPELRAWEGRGFSPIIGRPYLSETMLPIYSESRATGSAGTQAHKITESVVLYYPAGRGTMAIERMAGAILEHFKPGTPLSYGQASGVVQKAERRPLNAGADWISCPVNIDAVAYTAN